MCLITPTNFHQIHSRKPIHTVQSHPAMDGRPINKTMDREDLFRPDCRRVLIELFALMRTMQRAGAQYSSWYGHTNTWPSIWENVNRGPEYDEFPGNPDEIRVP